MPDKQSEDAAFWQERENEFRKHDTGDNKSLQAEWYSEGDRWRFRGTVRVLRVFTTLAIEAANGFTGNQDADLCKAWLDAMRRAGSGFTVTSEGRGSWIITGRIQDVFKASADYCLELRSRTKVGQAPSQLETAANGRVDAGTPNIAHKAPTPSPEQRAKERCAIVTPKLKLKGWTRCTWASKAGVSRNSVYEYLKGTRKLSRGNRRALAEELNLTPKDLPN